MGKCITVKPCFYLRGEKILGKIQYARFYMRKYSNPFSKRACISNDIVRLIFFEGLSVIIFATRNIWLGSVCICKQALILTDHRSNLSIFMNAYNIIGRSCELKMVWILINISFNDIHLLHGFTCGSLLLGFTSCVSGPKNSADFSFLQPGHCCVAVVVQEETSDILFVEINLLFGEKGVTKEEKKFLNIIIFKY